MSSTQHSVPTVSSIELPDVDAASPPPQQGSLSPDPRILDGISVDLQVSLGTASMTVQTLMALQRGSLIKLNTQLPSKLAIELNGKVIAYGEMVAIDDNFGLRITEIAQQ